MQRDTPSLLSADEIANPSLVFTELLDFMDVTALQEYMWVGLKSMVTGRFNHLSSREKEMQLEVYERLIKAVVAMNIIAQKNKTGRKE